ncbi:MAG: cupredoxin domain-containing protein, partial [Eubacteriales bacterium]
MGKRKLPPPNTVKKGRSERASTTTPLIVMGIVMIGLVVWIVSSLARSGSPPAPAALAQELNGVQVISMDLSASGYSPNNFAVKKGIPVRVNTNSTSDAGCVRGIMIPDFNINKPVDIGQDTFTFMPDKTGTFPFT